MIGRFEENTIYNEDCYKAIKDIPDKSIDLIVTDPPYLIENTTAGKDEFGIQNMNDQLAEENLVCSVDEKIFDEFMRIMKKPNMYIFCNHKQIPMYLDYFVVKQGCAFDILLWEKTNALPLYNNKYLTDKEYCLYFRRGGRCQPQSYEDAKTIFRHPINMADKDKFLHPTIKPLELIEKIVKNSTQENDIVLDTFMGSGTTAVACKNIGRKYLGFELNKKWFDIACDRLNNIDATGQISMFTI